MKPTGRLGTSAPGTTVMLVAVIALAPGVVHAAATPADGRGILSLPLADTVDPGRLEMGLWLAGVFSGGKSGAVGGPLGATVGFHSRGDLSLSTRMTSPVSPEQVWRGRDPVRVAVKWRYLDEKALRPGLAVDFGVRYVAEGFDLLPRVVVQKTYAPFAGVAALSFDGAFGSTGHLRRGLNLGIGAQGTFGEWRPLAEVGLRLAETRGYGPGAFHFSAGTAYEAGQGFQISIALTGGVGPEAAAVRLVFGLIYGTSDEREADHDADGVVDLVDRCPFVPEDLDFIEDDDGCPEGVIDAATGAAPVAPRFTTPNPRFRMRIRPTWIGAEDEESKEAGEEEDQP